MAEINIRKRGTKWEYRFEGAKVDGKRKQITKGGFRTKKEALEAGTKALAEYNHSGLHFTPSEISVSDYLDYWFDNYCKINLKYNTQVGYLRIINTHLKPTFGHYKLSAVNAAALQEYANTLKIQGYAKSTLVGILSVFQAALDYAVEPMRYLTISPMTFVKYPKVERKPRERIILDPKDWTRMINRFPEGNRFYIPLMVGFYTGLRISEAFALTWDDIDLNNKTLTVNKQIVKRNFGADVRKAVEQSGKKELKSSWYFTTTKTITSNRTIRFGDTLYEVFKAEKLRQTKNELKYGEYYTIHVLKKETDEKGNPMYRIIPTQKCLDSSLLRTKLICIDENGQYTSTDSFKYCSRVIHNELQIAFDYHSLRHPYVKPTTKNFSTFLKFLCHGLIISLPHYSFKVCKGFTVPCQIHFTLRYSVEPYTVLAEIFPILNHADSRTADTVKVKNKHDVSQFFFHSPVDFQ